MVLLPALCVLSLLFFVEPDPPVFAVSAISLLVSAGASFVGSNLWMRREESVEVSFSDLMIWAWLKRRRAEARLARGAELLGLDAAGNPVGNQPVISRDQRLKILHELSSALESKDPYTHGHSQRVERHSFRIGATLGLSVTDLEDLRLAAALHDVGKIRVSDRILRKPGKLTPEEYKEIQDHSVVGAWMVSSVGNPDVISAVRHHHERFDGAGYPDGISGHEIPLFARIIGVADAYDAITSSRPYRAKSERDRAIKIIKEESGKQFDPMVVKAFLSSLPARVPVTAALAFLLPGSSRVVRKVVTVARDVGGTGVAETVRAAGVTVMLSASVVAPVSQYVAPDRPRTAEVVSSDHKVMSASASETSDGTAGATAPAAEVDPSGTAERKESLERGRAFQDGGGTTLSDQAPVNVHGEDAAALAGEAPEGSIPVVDNPVFGPGDGGAGGAPDLDVPGAGNAGQGSGNSNGNANGGGGQGSGNSNGNANGGGGQGSGNSNGNANGGGAGKGRDGTGGSGQGSGNGNGGSTDVGNGNGGPGSNGPDADTGKGNTGSENPGNGGSDNPGSGGADDPGNAGGGNPGGSGGAGSGSGGGSGNGGSGSGGNGGSGGSGGSGPADPGGSGGRPGG